MYMYMYWIPQMAASNPMLRQMLDSNPQLRAMMTNPQVRAH